MKANFAEHSGAARININKVITVITQNIEKSKSSTWVPSTRKDSRAAD